MKTLIHSNVLFSAGTTLLCIVLILIAGLNISNSQTSDEFCLDEEEYIDDIPFETSSVFKDYMGWNFDTTDESNLALDEEEYVNDIPFDTEALFDEYIATVDINTSDNPLVLDEESYVDDIPFETEALFARYYGEKMDEMIAGTSLEEEAYSNDIDFDTELIAAEAINNNQGYHQNAACNTAKYFPATTAALKMELTPCASPVKNAESSYSLIDLFDYRDIYNYSSSRLINKYLQPMRFESLEKILFKAISY